VLLSAHTVQAALVRPFDLMPSWKANARHRRSEINACNTLTNRQADASCFWSSGCSMLIDE